MTEPSLGFWGSQSRCSLELHSFISRLDWRPRVCFQDSSLLGCWQESLIPSHVDLPMCSRVPRTWWPDAPRLISRIKWKPPCLSWPSFRSHTRSLLQTPLSTQVSPIQHGRGSHKGMNARRQESLEGHLLQTLLKISVLSSCDLPSSFLNFAFSAYFTFPTI